MPKRSILKSCKSTLAAPLPCSCIDGKACRIYVVGDEIRSVLSHCPDCVSDPERAAPHSILALRSFRRNPVYDSGRGGIFRVKAPNVVTLDSVKTGERRRRRRSRRRRSRRCSFRGGYGFGGMHFGGGHHGGGHHAFGRGGHGIDHRSRVAPGLASRSASRWRKSVIGGGGGKTTGTAL